MNTDRLSRFLRLIDLLQSRVGRTTYQVAEELGVSKRTVYRELRRLRDAGVPIVYDPDKGGHVITWNRRHSASAPSEDELTWLVVAAHISPLAKSPKWGPVISRCAYGILSSLSDRARERATRLIRSCVVDFSPLESGYGTSNVLPLVVEALARRRRVRIRYRPSNASEKLGQTLLSPYRLAGTCEGWFVLGRSSFHRAVRCFGLPQIVHGEATDQSYRVPQGYCRDVPPALLIRTCRKLVQLPDGALNAVDFPLVQGTRR